MIPSLTRLELLVTEMRFFLLPLVSISLEILKYSNK